MQPSFALIDLAAQMKETNCVTWIPPSKCSKRDSEIQNSVKEKPAVLSLEQQMVKLTSAEDHIVVDTSTDLQLQWALQRRGLAFDECALMSHSEHEIWVQQLLGQMTRDAPTGFAKVTAGQAIRADRELFTLMAQELQGPLQPDARGEMPMDKKMRELRTDPRVTMFLLPLPRQQPETPRRRRQRLARQSLEQLHQSGRRRRHVRLQRRSPCAHKNYVVSNNEIPLEMQSAGLST
jgi:hypothetical protein